MLELRNVIKDYPAGDGTVHALRGIDLQFRESEFVSVLGPSGCGKTTLLNIIGGLDQYTSGDLVINGTSTKHFKDRDWDAYRNHSIGFVFQSYNLIPHQSVLRNVELALTLSGVSKTERRRRAKAALEQVGLGSQINKKPNQMSGGQMQRVAIARALVNNPDIILADEPTGALDTETSVQIMEVLKSVSKDRLVIMVTHNPDLADRYASRIIRVLDGKIISDSAPLTREEYEAEQAHDRQAAAVGKRERKPSMSFFTAFSLSLNNLFTKKGRTLLTAFAGSIGIMGIALILSVSQGTTDYIDAVQEDTLSSYPLTIQKTSVDMTTLMESFMNLGSTESDHANDAVYKKSAIYDMLTALSEIDNYENDLTSFQTYLETECQDDSDGALGQAVSGVQYAYDLDLLVYTKNIDGNIIHSDTSELFQQIVSQYMGMSGTLSDSGETSSGSNLINTLRSSTGAGSMNLWQEILPAKDGGLVNNLVKNQYDVVYGTWPSAYDEIVLVLDKNNELDDMTLYALGLESEDTIKAIQEAATNGTTLEMDDASWSYADICNMEFHVVLNSDCYSYDENTGLYTDLRKTDAGLRYLYDNGLTLKVVGIIRPNDDAQSAMLTGSIAYTSALTEYVVEKSHSADVVNAQLDNPGTDVLTGLPFQENSGNLSEADKASAFRDYIAGLDESGKAAVYVKIMSIPAQDELDAMTAQAMAGKTRQDMEDAMMQALTQEMGMSQDSVDAYIGAMSDEDLTELFTEAVQAQVSARYAQQVQEQTAAMTPQQLAGALDMAAQGYTDSQCAEWYDDVMEFSDSTYEDNLARIGYVDLKSPSAINIYASSFENKDTIEDAIADYNEGVEQLSQIKYTDYVGLMMSSVTTIINAITYVLLAFVAISLLVSSIMIGVITLISVQERTKEIGILRSIGASKHDVSSMFNAETMIIGLASGLLGIGVTYLLCIPINALLHHLTGITTLNAVLPWKAALILVLISVVLSLIAGLIPSRSAAKKDPVVALRTE
ncbi:MAG: ATP-binding cassette domain-containing protein [Faecousia sp.]